MLKISEVFHRETSSDCDWTHITQAAPSCAPLPTLPSSAPTTDATVTVALAAGPRALDGLRGGTLDI